MRVVFQISILDHDHVPRGGLNGRTERGTLAPVLDVVPAPDERPVSPYLLAAGEEIRLGASKGDLTEVRVGGNTIGWARRSGLWRVDEAPRYTASSGSK